MIDYRSAIRPPADDILLEIADYVLNYQIDNEQAWLTARLCLMDSIACAFAAVDIPACRQCLGPIVDGAQLIDGAQVPATDFRLDPVQAAFNIGTLIRWLDFNDTWLAAEWGHPSDNLGGILASADYLSRQNLKKGKQPLLLRYVLSALIKAYEIQGILALDNSFNQIGLDHVILVRVATTAVVTAMLGGNKNQIVNALSNAWADGGALRSYRHAPNTGSRKSWAAGDATSRGVWHALMSMRGEMGYPSILSTERWGFYDVLFKGQTFTRSRPFASYVVENILFKISYPAEFHAQTAAEAAITLHLKVKDKIDKIKKITIETQKAGATIIDKTGPLNNPADRDHCIQYIVAIGLIFGHLTIEDYEDKRANDPRIDSLRQKMQVVESPRFSKDYFDPNKRAIGNAVEIHFSDNSKSERVQIDYPIGHRKRRKQGITLLYDKFRCICSNKLGASNVEQLIESFADGQKLDSLPVHEFMDKFVGK